VLNAHLKSSQIMDHDPKQLGQKQNREKLQEAIKLTSIPKLAPQAN
jgi:hypothetical protein